MGWFSKKRISAPVIGSDSAEAVRRSAVKGLRSPDGCLVCPRCQGESQHKIEDLRHWMQEQNLDALCCPGCGTFLALD
jgi:uncharacterized protein YbaR (Trm112 family)